MKKGVNGWMISGFQGEVPVVDAARKARELGFDSIELCFGVGELTPETSEASLARMKSAIHAIGIEVGSMATGYYWTQSLSSPDETERRAAVTFTKAYIKAARALGVEAILVVPGDVDVPWDASRPVVPAKKAYELSQQSIRALLPSAEQQGVVLGIENVWNKFLTGPFEFSAFIDSFGSPYVKAYFDVGNCLINGYSEHWIEILGKRIVRVHVKNFRRRDGGGTLSDFTGSLLDGDVNWPAVLKGLKAVGYDGYLTAEVLISEKGMPDTELAGKVCREMKDLLAQHT